MRSGDPCPKCVDGVYLAYRTVRCRDLMFSVRYLKCNSCGATGKQWIESRPPRVTITRSGKASAENASEAPLKPVFAIEGSGDKVTMEADV